MISGCVAGRRAICCSAMMVSRWVLYFLAIKTLVRFFAINLRVHSRLHSGSIQVGMVRLRRYCSQQAEQARNSQYSQVIWLRRTERQIIHSDICDEWWWLFVIVYVYVFFVSIFCIVGFYTSLNCPTGLLFHLQLQFVIGTFWKETWMIENEIENEI